ncbi:hypothetical protein CKO31_01075 [Thiohalocapsa halophila]|uniref:Uncharacterized protein n=1 Tax=Thiohalocapsa halophila TaxID=69359 RepID=A0ABS1CBP4_9GAMM|nr:hypothetical protein [Thiohalocapsa halophila]MBK1629346.1 hypothetical protein [Thiohalocapsa halophila]
MHLIGAGIEPGGRQVQEDGAHRSAPYSGSAVCRLARLEALQQLPQLVGPGRALGERGYLDPERGCGLVGRGAGLALLIERGLKLGDLLGAEVERGLRLLGGLLGAVDVT